MRKVPFTPAELRDHLAQLTDLVNLYSAAYDEGYTSRKQAAIPGRSNEPARPTEESLINGESLRSDLLMMTHALDTVSNKKKHLERKLGFPSVVVDYRPRKRRRRRAQGYGALAEAAFGVRRQDADAG